MCALVLAKRQPVLTAADESSLQCGSINMGSVFGMCEPENTFAGIQKFPAIMCGMLIF
jgi:hypothetical protein